jgi:hypothetical protein
MNMHDRVRFSLRSLFVATTVVVCATFAVTWLWQRLDLFPFPQVEPKTFSSKEWKAWTVKDMRQSEDIRRAYTRRDMLDDMLAKHRLIGLHRRDLVKLLGEPDGDPVPKDWDIAYFVGVDFVDYVVLVLRLDSHDKVEAFEVKMY